MLLVFLFLLNFIVFLILGIIFSKIDVEISFEYDNLHKNIAKTKGNFKHKVDFNIYLYKIKFLKINAKYLKIIKNFTKGKTVKPFKLKSLKKLNINISKVFFKANINSIDDFFTMNIVSIISILFSNLLGYLSFKNDIKTIYFDINPIFGNISENQILFLKEDEKKPIVRIDTKLEILVEFTTLNLIKFIQYANKKAKIYNE